MQIGGLLVLFSDLIWHMYCFQYTESDLCWGWFLVYIETSGLSAIECMGMSCIRKHVVLCVYMLVSSEVPP